MRNLKLQKAKNLNIKIKKQQAKKETKEVQEMNKNLKKKLKKIEGNQ